MKKWLKLLFYLPLLNSHALFAQEESDFYVETSHLGVSKNFILDYDGNGTDILDDSPTLINAINQLTQLDNGGKIFFPSGTYYLGEIEMKSNVHLEFSKDAIVIPVEKSNDKNYAVFELGGSGQIIENVSIQGMDGQFLIDLRNVVNINVTVFRVNAVKNFMLSNFFVEDALTKFSTIGTGFEEVGNEYVIPENGLIKNGHVENADYGYGLIQTQAGKNILFENISGTGGVTLRLETGYQKMNELQVGGVFNMVARNVSCKNGNAAVMISPHETQNGHVEIDGITAVSCGIGVRLGKGYVRNQLLDTDLTPGMFASTSWVKNVTSTFGTSTQMKSKHFKYMPCDYRDEVIETEAHTGTVKIYTGPAIVAVLNETVGDVPGKYNIGLSNVTAIGYECQNDIVFSEDADTNCTGVQVGCPKAETQSVTLSASFSNKIEIIPTQQMTAFTLGTWRAWTELKWLIRQEG